MRTSISALGSLFLLLLAGVFLLQMVGLESQISAARSCYDSVVDAVEDSDGSPAVIADCKKKVKAAGYSLTVEALKNGRQPMYLVTLHYSLKGALWHNEKLYDGSIKGYARP